MSVLKLNELWGEPSFKRRMLSTALRVTREEFETVWPPNATPNLHSGRKDLLESDLILIPCSLSTTEHWFLLAVFPKKYLMAFLDNAASDYVEPSAGVVMKKMF